MHNDLHLDERLRPEDLLYTVFFLGERLSWASLTTDCPSIMAEDLLLEVKDGQLLIDGEDCPDGQSRVGGQTVFVVNPQTARTHHLILDSQQGLLVENDPGSGVRTQDDSRIVIDGRRLLAWAGTAFTYVGPRPVQDHTVIDDFPVGGTVLTPDLLLERRPEQWRLTVFNPEVSINPLAALEQKPAAEFPPGFPDYRRSPRLHLEPPSDKITVNAAPEPPEYDKNSLLKTILPPLMMLVASAVTSMVIGRNPLMMMGMGCMSLVTAAFTASQYLSGRKATRAKRVEQATNYRAYLLSVVGRLRRLWAQERQVLNYLSPSPTALEGMITRYDSRIYERMRNNKDFLTVSLGTGEAASHLQVSADGSQRKFVSGPSQTQKIVDEFTIQKDVPITVDLADATLGLVGPPKVTQTAVANLLLQISFFHSYRDVSLIALVSEQAYRKKWSIWRFLPHFKIWELNTRGIIHDTHSRDMVLNSFCHILHQRRAALRESRREHIDFDRHYVLVIMDDSWLAEHSLNEFLAEDMSRLGVTVIWCQAERSQLPETVNTLVEYAGREVGQLVNDHSTYVDKRFTPHPAPRVDSLEACVRRLANLRHVEAEKNAVPSMVDFLGLYQVKRVEELGVEARWERANTAKSLAVPLGLRGKDDVVELNLHERAHGPHGLVAGTTGSGKSEIVQSYILSLAVNFAPEDVGFLPIDFKGGGMANLFQGLPHLLGSITNLDGAGTARALASIDAELKKRQRLFGQYGVNNINGYTKLYKLGKSELDKPGLSAEEQAKYPTEPLPHLFLISDEFAELKANQPDFIDALVSTARIGRSLGVHLILATQKPSGVVTDQIWSNSRFKLALKVADTSDSNEVIKTPDAAFIKEPGRAYLQVGNNEIYELFQSAWSGADYEPDAVGRSNSDERLFRINDLGQYELALPDFSDIEEAGQDSLIDSAKPERQTQLDAVVEYIARTAQRTEAVLPAKPWLPTLGERLVLPGESTWPKQADDSTDRHSDSSDNADRGPDQGGRTADAGLARDRSTDCRSNHWQTPFGLLDIPWHQEQRPFTFDLTAQSHTGLFGSSGFGKTTAVSSLVLGLAQRHTPTQAQFLLLDFSHNGLLPLRQLPHVIDHVGLDEAEKLAKALGRITDSLLQRSRLLKQAGVTSLEQYEARTGQRLPRILVILDGYDALGQDSTREEVDSALAAILRDGGALGLTLILTVNRVGALRSTLLSNLPTRIALYLNDEYDLQSLFGRERQIQTDIPGRGQLLVDDRPTAIQIYQPVEGADGNELLTNLETEVARLDQAWQGERPLPIPMVPERLTLEDFEAREDVQTVLEEGGLAFGLAYSDAQLRAERPTDPAAFTLIAYSDEDQLNLLENLLLLKLRRPDSKRLVVDLEERFDTISDQYPDPATDSDFQLVSTPDDLQDALMFLSRYEILARKKKAGDPATLVIADLASFVREADLSAEDLASSLRLSHKAGLSSLIFSPHNYIAKSYDPVPKALRELKYQAIVGCRAFDSALISTSGISAEPPLQPNQAYFVSKGGQAYDKLLLPASDSDIDL